MLPLEPGLTEPVCVLEAGFLPQAVIRHAAAMTQIRIRVNFFIIQCPFCCYIVTNWFSEVIIPDTNIMTHYTAKKEGLQVFIT